MALALSQNGYGVAAGKLRAHRRYQGHLPASTLPVPSQLPSDEGVLLESEDSLPHRPSGATTCPGLQLIISTRPALQKCAVNDGLLTTQ